MIDDLIYRHLNSKTWCHHLQLLCQGIRQSLYKLLDIECRNSDIILIGRGCRHSQELTCVCRLARSVDTCKQTDQFNIFWAEWREKNGNFLQTRHTKQ